MSASEATLTDLQTERERLKAEQAREDYEQALAETCRSADVYAAARELRNIVARAATRLPQRLESEIEGEREESRIHYLMSDAIGDVLREVGEAVAAATEESQPELGTAFRKGIQPRALLTVSQWADRYRWLESGTNLPGQWRTDRVPYLREIMDSLSEHSPVQKVTFMKASGVGGPLALDTPLPTPQGWTTMGQIQTQDQVFDERGVPCNVVFVSEVFHNRACYRITLSDGATFVADHAHRWHVLDAFPGHGGKRRGSKGPRGRTITTHELHDTYLRGTRRRYSIPVACALDLSAVDLPVAPYALGAWLANGQIGANQLTYHDDDAAEIVGLLQAAGESARPRKMAWSHGQATNIIVGEGQPGHCLRGHCLEERGWFRNRDGVIVCRECHRQHAMHHKYGRAMDPVLPHRQLLKRLQGLGVTAAKHIPVAYLRASVSQRLELLRGLMDADGSITKNGRCEYSTVSPDLKAGVLELVRSLGLKPVCYKARRKGFGTDGAKREGCHYRISFLAYRDTAVFGLTRKRDRQPCREDGKPGVVGVRRVVSVEPVESVPVRCIGVDSPSHLYLAGRCMVPTHNTEVLYNWLGYIMHQLQNKDTMLVVPTLELRNRSLNPRLRKTFQETTVLGELVSGAQRSKANRDDLIEYGARARIIKAGANSPDSLRSDHLPYVILDEVDGFAWEVGQEGDPLTLIENRQRTFSRAKTYLVSTPTVEGDSRIAQSYARSDQRRYHVPCPHCGHMHPLEWKHFHYKTAIDAEPGEGDEERVPEVAEAWMSCPDCGGQIDEGHKPHMLAGGRWIARRPKVSHHRGYHLNALYAPIALGLTWRAIAQKWLDSQQDVSELKGVTNTYLGEVWREQGDSIEDLSLITRLEPYEPDELPIVSISAGVDVQKDRLEASIAGWGAGEQAWLLDHLIIPGETSAAGEGAWLDLEPALLDQGVEWACIDSGYRADAVYEWVKARRWSWATKGMEGMSRPVIEDERRRKQRLRYRRKKGVPVEPIGVDNAKAILYARLKQEEPGPGYIHFRQTSAFDDEYFAQLGAEKLVKRKRRGRTAQEWVQTRSRNEALDCLVLALAAVRLAGVDLDALAAAGRYMRGLRSQAAGAAKEKEQGGTPKPAKHDTGFGSEDWAL